MITAEELVAALVAEGWTYEQEEPMNSDERLWWDRANRWPELEDRLPREPGEPEGFHVRRNTEDGYPLMGSSPAERAESIERAARIKEQNMRDHPFSGDHPLYCRAWSGPSFSGDPVTTGVVAMRVQCGYPRDMHPGERS